MKEKELTVFKSEIKGVTLFEFTVNPKTAAKAILLTLGITTAVIGGKYVADFIDDTLRPTYVVNGNSMPLIDEPQQWIRPTDWKRR